MTDKLQAEIARAKRIAERELKDALDTVNLGRMEEQMRSLVGRLDHLEGVLEQVEHNQRRARPEDPA